MPRAVRQLRIRTVRELVHAGMRTSCTHVASQPMAVDPYGAAQAARPRPHRTFHRNESTVTS
jgi:hypothetical protein